MAIETVNARYEGFIFDGQNSRNYGVYVTDVEVFGAPVRNVEMIQIPGRNGAYALDNGFYENIQVTYKCAIGCESQADFNAGISAFRNMLASRIGYKRLEDEINTDEYRMACFHGGISVPTLNKDTATFDVVFDCKPQRFLKSGENEVSIGTSRTLANPTLYQAHPLLSFTASGAGAIQINSDTISVTNQPIGDIVLANVVKLNSGESVTWSDTSRYLTGDAIRIDSIPAIQTTVVTDSYSYANYTNYISDDMDYLSTTNTSRGMVITHSLPTPPQYVAGTAKSDTYSATVINKVKHKTTGNIVDCTINLTVAIAYDGANNITVTNTVTTSIGTASTAVTINTVIVNSTKSSLGGTAYIDLDIGEAYSIDGGAVVSINDSVSIGAALPVLGVGSNTVSKTGSVANLKVTPRWWQL